jgi:DNA-binding transcriptional LysR family regulator
MGISLSKLQQLLTVARCGSISRAAEELHISQPALSRSIAATERQYGFPIFSRIGHGIHPTAAGAQVLTQAEPLLQSLRVFGSNLKLLAAGKTGALRMGLPPLLASQLLPNLASDFFTPAIQAELRVSVRPGPVLLDELKNDAIELLFFAESQIEHGPDIDTQRVGAMQPVCVVRRGHPLVSRAKSSKRALTLDDLGKFPWASSVEPPAMGKLLNPARLLCDNYHVLREAVQQTDLICICSKAFVARDITEGRLREIHVEGFLPDKSMVFVATLKGRILSPLAVKAIERVRAYLAAQS